VRPVNKFWIISFILAFSLQTFGAENKVFSYTHPETGDVYNIEIEQPSEKTLRYWSPANLTAKKVGSLIQNGYSNASRITTEAVHDFPLAASTFYGASFLVNLRSCLFDRSNDPTCIDNFIAHQLKDPITHIGFLAFIAGQKGSSEILDYIAVRQGWVRNPNQFNAIYKELLKISPGSNPQAILQSLHAQFPPPSTASYFNQIKSLTGLAAGFVLSGIVGDFLRDPFIQHCFVTPTYGPARLSKEIARMGMTPQKACDISWDTWVSTGKIIDYAPNIASAAISQMILHKALPKFNAKLARVTYLLRGIRFFRVAGSILPQSRAVLLVENAYFFLELDGLLNPWIRDPFESSKMSTELNVQTKLLTKLTSKGIEFPTACLKTLNNRFTPTELSGFLTADLIQYLREHDPDCGTLPISPMRQIKDFAKANENWRSYWFSKAQNSLQNWQREMLSLQSNVQDAQKFYEEVLNFLAQGKNRKLDAQAFAEIMKKYDLENYDESYPSVYAHFNFRNRSDFFLTMMVCGPLPGESLYKNSFGFPMMYLPPSLVTKEAQASCRSLPRGGKATPPASNWDDWSGGYRLVAGRAYTDLLNILIVNIRPEFRSGESALAKLWDSELKPQTAKIILEKKKAFSKVQKKVEYAMNREDAYASDKSIFKSMPTGYISYGFLNHIESELNLLLKLVQNLQGWQLTDTESQMIAAVFAAAKDSAKTKVLLDFIKEENLSEILTLKINQYSDPSLKDFLTQETVVEILKKKLADHVQKNSESKSGFELEMATALYERIEALLKVIPETQIYKITVTSPL
jgi:hypothetical protein